MEVLELRQNVHNLSSIILCSSELKREQLGSYRKSDGLIFQVVCANLMCKLVPVCFRK